LATISAVIVLPKGSFSCSARTASAASLVGGFGAVFGTTQVEFSARLGPFVLSR